MSRLSMLLVALVLMAFCGRAAAEEKSKTAEVMTKYFKGKESPVAHANAGQVDEATLKAFVESFMTLANEKPPVGDVEAWKKKVSTLVDATKALQEKKEGAAAAFKEATDCKACHTAFRPKKPQ